MQSSKTEPERNRKSAVTSNEIESVFKKLPTNKSSGADVFTGEVYQIFREELIN